MEDAINPLRPHAVHRVWRCRYEFRLDPHNGGRWDALADTVSDEQLEAFAVCGAPEEAAEKLHARFSPWCDRLSIMTTYAMEKEAERSLLATLRSLS